MTRIFQEREILDALKFANEGGQALHLISGRHAYLRRDTPDCFKGRMEIAHLFDQDAKRLHKTAQRLGVRVIRIEHPGTPKQHIDLCGRPLALAKLFFRKDSQEVRPLSWAANSHHTPQALRESQRSNCPRCLDRDLYP